MDSKIIFLVLIILLLVILVHRKREFFYQASRCETCGNLEISSPLNSVDCCNYFTIVSQNDYNLDDVYGPKCLNTCLVEHIAKINFEEALKQKPVEKDILKFNRENPNDGFCHSLNVKHKGVNKCINNCQDECNSSDNCHIRNDICVEKSLNYLSGGSMLNSTKCSFESSDKKGCVNKYMNSIETLKKIYNEEVEKQDSVKCKV